MSKGTAETEDGNKDILEEFESLFEVVAVRNESQILREFRKGLTFLRFSPILERAFLNYYLSKHLWQIRIAIILGICLYGVFGVLDAIVFPEAKESMWLIRFLGVIPFGLLFLFLTFKVKNERFLQLFHSALVVIGGVGIIGMIYIALPDKAFLYYAGLMLVVFYAYTLSALRFYYSTISSLIVTALYPLTDIFLIGSPDEYLTTNMFFLSSMDLIGVPVAYMRERTIRRDFLLTMLLAFEKRKTQELNLKLKDISYIDGLTGVANRLKFEEFFTQEWNRAKRTKKPLSILMIDLDFFKNYNDLLGHLEGDNCLKEVASIMSKHVRSDMDLVARFGGEEFVVVLPETDLRSALKVAERIRKDVEELRIAHPASKASKYVTVSVGVASMIPAENLKKEVLINMADKALYEAKGKGRNRVEFFQPEGELSGNADTQR